MPSGRFVDDANHSSSSWTTFPSGPSVEGSAVDTSDGHIPIPRQELVAAPLLGPSEISERSVGKVKGHSWPIRTSEPSLRLGVLEPGLNQRKLGTNKGSKLQRHCTMVSLAGCISGARSCEVRLRSRQTDEVTFGFDARQ